MRMHVEQARQQHAAPGLDDGAGVLRRRAGLGDRGDAAFGDVDIAGRTQLRVLGIEDARIADQDRLLERVAQAQRARLDRGRLGGDLQRLELVRLRFPAGLDELGEARIDRREHARAVGVHPDIGRLEIGAAQRVERQRALLGTACERGVRELLQAQLAGRQRREALLRRLRKRADGDAERLDRAVDRHVDRRTLDRDLAAIDRAGPRRAAGAQREALVDLGAEGRGAADAELGQRAVRREPEAFLVVGPAAVLAVAEVGRDAAIVGDGRHMLASHMAREQHGVAVFALGLCGSARKQRECRDDLDAGHGVP